MGVARGLAMREVNLMPNGCHNNTNWFIVAGLVLILIGVLEED
jgi:uncharacterized membrane protein HdeD (DUF308 family)